MIESQVVKEWLSEGIEKAKKEERLETLRQTLRVLLEDCFGSLPDGLQRQIETVADPDRLQRAVRQIPRLGSLEELTL